MKKETKQSTKKRKKSVSTKTMLLTLLGLTVGFAAALYLFAAFYFSSHFFFGTVINGMNCERMTVDDVKDRLQSYISQYSLTLITRGGETELISAEDLDMRYADDQGVEALMDAQNPFLWFTHMVKPTDLQVAANMTYDTAIVSSIVDTLNCMQPEHVIQPTDAVIAQENGQFVIIPEVTGNALMRESLIAAVIDAVNTGKTEINLEELDLYIKPAIYSTDPALVTEAEYLNKLATAHITYDFGDNRIYTIDTELLKTWIVPVEDGTYAINRDSVTAYVKQMAYDTDTFGLAHEFKTSYGQTITLAKGGDYGWVINKDRTADALIEAIETQYQGTLEPVYRYKGIDRGINDIGDTYVEICIEDQTMWCYKDGQLIATTGIVTGNHSTGYDTPSGSVWAIDAKKKDVSFTLYDVDVTFWLPFNDQVGIHDASWRSPEEYNGSTFLTNGSHGCINTPYDAAEKIFNAMEIGYPVIVYYSLEQPVGPQPTKQTSVG